MNRLLTAVFPPPAAFGIAFSLLLLLVGGLPLFVVPWATDSYELSKVVAFRCVVAMLAALVLGAAVLGWRLRVRFKALNGFVLLFLLWTALSTLWSEAPALALDETLSTGVLVLFFFLFQALVAARRRQMLAVVYTLALVSLGIATLVVLQDFRASFFPATITVRRVLNDWRDELSRVALGNTSHIADFLVAGFLVWSGVLLLARSGRLKALAIGALWIHAAALIVSWSVHSNLSLLIAFVTGVFLLKSYIRKKRILRLRPAAISLALGWAMIIAFYTVDHPVNPHGSAIWSSRAEADHAAYGLALPEGGFRGGIFSQAFASPRWQAGLPTRQAIWLTTLWIIKDHPWFGVGAGNFTYVYPATIAPIVLNDVDLAPYAGSWTNAAHNDLLQTWSETGIVGAFLLVIIVALALKGAWERLQSGTSFGNAVILAVGFAMLVAICLQSMMNFPLQLPVSSMLFMILLALPLALPPGGRERQDLMVPVERPFGPVQLGVFMKNMAHPTELYVYTDLGRGAAMSVAAVLGMAGLGGAWLLSAPLRADIAYRSIYEIKSDPVRGNTPAAFESVIALSPDVLETWPGHVNCRSAYQEALLRGGRLDEVVRQTPLVLEKLNAVEVYQRRAMALEALGRGEEAVPDWDEIFRRHEDFGRLFPQEFRAYMQRHPERFQ